MRKIKHVIDTNVFLSEGRGVFYEFGEDDVVIPSTVLSELDSKKSDEGLGYTARSVITEIFEIMEGTLGERESRIREGFGNLILSFDQDILRSLPDDYPLDEANSDAKILATCLLYQERGDEVILVTKDREFTVVANAFGVQTIDLTITDKPELKSHIREIETKYISDEEMQTLYDTGCVRLDLNVPRNIGLILLSYDGSKSALAVSGAQWEFHKVQKNHRGLVDGRNAEQSIALHLLAQTDVDIVSLSGPAGSGKSYIALAAGLDAVDSKEDPIDKVIVYRPINPVGGKTQDIGFLPGTQAEKMAPHVEPVQDTLEALLPNKNEAKKYLEKGIVTVDGVAFVRGRTINNAMIIVEEAQNLEYATLLTLLTRAGNNTRIVLVWDMSQRDNQYISKTDGVHKVVSKLMDSSIFAHVPFKKSERSRISNVVVTLLDEL